MVNDIRDLTSVAGLAAATNIAVAVLKPLLGVSGRWTHLLAAVVSATLAVAAYRAGVFPPGADTTTVAVTAAMAWLTAIGAHQATFGVKTGRE